MDFKSEGKSRIYSEKDGVRDIGPSRQQLAEAEVVPFDPKHACCFSGAAAKIL